MVDISKRRNDRCQIMKVIFDATQGSHSRHAGPADLAHLNLSHQELADGLNYLVNEGLITISDVGSPDILSGEYEAEWRYSITHRGIREMEKSLGGQGKPTEEPVVIRPRNPEGHAFISYAREDSRRVDALQQTLQAVGVPVWRDTADLWPGEDWRMKIRHAITEHALVFIACFSQASISRVKGYYNEELVLAIEQLRLRPLDNPWLIPVRFDECEIPDRDIGGGRTLMSIQCADLFGEHSHEGIARLKAGVMRILERHSHR
jgi:hypothetical protein